MFCFHCITSQSKMWNINQVSDLSSLTGLALFPWGRSMSSFECKFFYPEAFLFGQLRLNCLVLRISYFEVFASFAEQCAEQILQFVTSKDFRNVLLVEKLDITSHISSCTPAARCRRATSISLSVCFFIAFFFAVLFLIESNWLLYRNSRW